MTKNSKKGKEELITLIDYYDLNKFYLITFEDTEIINSFNVKRLSEIKKEIRNRGGNKTKFSLKVENMTITKLQEYLDDAIKQYEKLKDTYFNHKNVCDDKNIIKIDSIFLTISIATRELYTRTLRLRKCEERNDAGIYFAGGLKPWKI